MGSFEREEDESNRGEGSEGEVGIRRIGDYRIIREVGRGGMGVVFEAEQVSLGRRVALKVLPEQVTRDAKALERFRREAKAAARLHHTNIVPVYEVGREGEVAFYAMQYIEGQGLDQIVRQLARDPAPEVFEGDGRESGGEVAGAMVRIAARTRRVALGPDRADSDSIGEETEAVETLEGPLTEVPETVSDAPSGDVEGSAAEMEPTEVVGRGRGPGLGLGSGWYREVARIGRQVAGGLAHAHARGVVHRDIKPSNLLLDTAGVVWITDFGLAKAEEDGLTATGDLLGTFRYMAPERFRGEADARADVYGLGATLYELLTLRPAFPGSNRLTLMKQIQSEEPVAPRVLNGQVPADLETIVLKAMEKDPERRYQTAEALERELGRFLADEPIQARPIGVVERYWRWARRNPGIAVLGGVLTAVLVLATVGSLLAARGYQEQANLQSYLASEKDEEREQADRARSKEAAARRRADRANVALRAAQEELRRTVYATRTNLALAAFESNDVLRFRSLLDLCRPEAGEPDLRGWEWGFLRSLDQEAKRTFREHDEVVSRVLFSPEGQRIASVHLGGTVLIWDPETGKILRALLPDKPVMALGPWTGGLNGLAWSPDGRRIAVSSADSKVRVWDVESGEKRLERFMDGSVVCLSFDPGGHRLAMGSAKHWVRVIDSETGEVLSSMRAGHGGPVTAVKFSPDGRRLASSGNDRVIKIWDTETADCLHVLEGNLSFSTDVAYSPDGRNVVSAGVDGAIREWDAESGEAVAVRRAHEAAVESVEFSRDGRFLISGSEDQTVKLWDTRTWENLHTYRGHTGTVASVSFRPDGKVIASSSADRTVKLWDVDGSGQPRVLLDSTPRRFDAGVWSVAFSPDGSVLASSHGDGGNSIRIWDEGGELERVLEGGQNGFVVDLAFSPDGGTLASASDDATVMLWDRASWSRLRTLNGHIREVTGVAFRPDGRELASSSKDHTVRVWDVESGELLRTLRKHASEVLDLAYSPDGRELASVGNDDNLVLWDARSGEVRKWIPHRTALECVTFSPDGRVVAAGDYDGWIWFWNRGSGERERAIAAHEGQVGGLAFSPDGRRLVSCGRDRSVKLWDVSSGQMVLALKGHARPVQDVTFSHDGRRIASGGLDRTIRVWTSKGGDDAEPAGATNAAR